MTPPKQIAAAPAVGLEHRLALSRARRELSRLRVELADSRAGYRREQLRAELAHAHGLERPVADLRWYEHRVQLAHLRVLQSELDLAALETG